LKILRIAFYEPYSMGFGGNFITQRLILERMTKEHFHPIIVSPEDGVANNYYRKMGIECVVIPQYGALRMYGGAALRVDTLKKIKSIFDLLRYNLKIAIFLRKRKIDIVYNNCVRAQITTGIGARLARVPTLLYVKGVLSNPIIDRLSIILANKVLFFSTQNRDDQYQFFIRFFKKKIDILRIGLNPKEIIEVDDGYDYSALCKDLDIDAKIINIALVGQLYQPKGQHIAIEALAKVVTKFPLIKLYLIGDHVIKEYISYKTELERLIDKHNLSDHVVFTGWRNDTLNIISIMDIIIHPSLAEGFGRAVLESMALGKPVIAAAVGGLREAIKDGNNGYLVPPGDIDALAERLCILLSSQNLREQLGKEAKKTVFSSYLIDDKVKTLLRIWTNMVVS